MPQAHTIFVLTLLGSIGAGCVSGAEPEASVFRVKEILLCSAHRPAQRSFLCPSGMQIYIVSAFHGPQSALIQSRGALPEGAALCHSLSSPITSASLVNEITPAFCLMAKDVTKPLKQMCESKTNCDVSPDQFATNQTLCRGVSNEMLISYRCEPSPQMIKSRTVCQDTYVEIKCTSYGPEESIVVLDAQLLTEVDSPTCPTIIEPPSSVGVCPRRLEVTAGLVEMCGRERTCSVMPDAAMLPPGYPSLCARRHLRLIYACVPPDVLEDERRLVGKHLPRQSKPRQPYQKKNRREQNPVHPTRVSVVSTYPQEQRDSGVFERAAYPTFMEATLPPRPATPTDVPEPIKLLPNNISMFPMVMGVLVGLVVLVLLILLLIALGFRTRRQRAAYARRKALSDQANTETTFSEAEKTQQHQHQRQAPSPLAQQTSIMNGYGYQQGSDNGVSAGLASTYLPHAMFATETCWPAGLQSVPPGGNYFDEEVPGVAFSPLGRDSGSHGYVQLPISNSHNSGLVYSHQSSTTTMNRSANHLLPFTVSHSCAPAEVFSGGPRMCSPAVNSSLSTESDRFSGQASSHPSSFQPLYPSSGTACVSPRSLRQQKDEQTTQQPQQQQQQQHLWIGYDEGPGVSVESTNQLLVAQEGGEPQGGPSASLESLIEPPDSFKNRPPTGLLMDLVPPQMAQLRRLDTSCNGGGGWAWHEGQFNGR